MRVNRDTVFRPVNLRLETPEECALIALLLAPISAMTAGQMVRGVGAEPIHTKIAYDELVQAAEDGGISMSNLIAEAINRNKGRW